MHSYLNLVNRVLHTGITRPNRTGIDTLSIFGESIQHDMSLGMPVLTTKKVNFRACVVELLWFLRGDTNIKYLQDNNVHIWDAWADANGNLGPVYGKQWVESGKNRINQVDYVINEIKHNPYSRRIILDAWSPSDLADMALPPCHVLYQFYADPASNSLDLQVYMRSADLFLGLPFDIAEGALLLSLIAKITGYTPRKVKYTLGDAHIYKSHLTQVGIQLEREPLVLPTLKIAKKESIYDYDINDIELLNYEHHGFLKGEVAV